MVTAKEKPIAVAEFIRRQIHTCGKSQKEIAREAGFATPNIITMFKQGTTKIPVRKAGALAKALGVDPAYLLRLVLREYLPETYAAIEEIAPGLALTENEKWLIGEWRVISEGRDVVGIISSTGRGMSILVDRKLGAAFGRPRKS